MQKRFLAFATVAYASSVQHSSVVFAAKNACFSCTCRFAGAELKFFRKRAKLFAVSAEEVNGKSWPSRQTGKRVGRMPCLNLNHGEYMAAGENAAGQLDRTVPAEDESNTEVSNG